MLKGFIAALSAGYLLYRWDLSRRQRELQLGATSRALPDEVTTWEGEGGGLPESGGQTATPAVAPTTGIASAAGPVI